MGIGVAALGIANVATGNIALGAAMVGAGVTQSSIAGRRGRESQSMQAKARAIDNLITRSRGKSKMTAGGRAALARAAATRSAVANRPTARLARAAAAAKSRDGNVDAYTRTQNGRTVSVRGYAR